MNRAIDLRYRDENGRISVRRILPLKIAFLEVRLIVLGWCCLRQDYRKFRIDRIDRIGAVTATEDSVRPRRVALLREYVGQMMAAQTSDRALKHPPTVS